MNSDRIVSFAAILISVSTLIVLIYQTNIMRSQQRLSVLPHLMTSNEYIGTPNYRLILRNSGIGPAFIESVKIFHKEKTYEMDFAKFMIDHVPEFDSIDNVYYSNIAPGLLIPAEKSINLLEIHDSLKDSKNLYALIGKLVMEENLDFEIVYSSIYGEKWRITKDTVYPEPLD